MKKPTDAPCPFVLKMMREDFEFGEIMGHMKECPVCKKITKKRIFEIKKNLGIDRDEEQVHQTMLLHLVLGR